jgi:formate/nitrite transporter
MLHSCMWHDACLLFLVSLFALIFSLVTFSTMNDVESGPSTTGKPSSTSMHEEDVPTKNPLEHDKSSLTQTDFHPEPASPHPDQQAHCSTAGAAETSAQSLPRALAHNLAAMVSTPRTKAPKDTLKAVYVAGTYKAALTLDILMVQSFMAGLYIGMASHLYLAIGGGVLGAIFFPTGLVAVLLTSAELFTGDALIFVASVLGGKVTLRSLCRNWTVSWICNFVGCLAWAYFMVYLPDSLGDLDKNEYAVKVALAKAHQPSGAIFLKGVGANFMVCLGVWQYTCAEEVAGKVLALFFPIAGFVIMGFDHCIANQFFIRTLLLRTVVYYPVLLLTYLLC